MISCTEFILAYNELFKFLHKRYGKKAVIDFWIYISDNFLTNLEHLVEEKGIAGMAEYWTHTLTEEKAEYCMEVGKKHFRIYMKKCPSVGIMNQRKVEKYPYYCEHCDILYKRIIEKYGFDYRIKFIDKNKGICSIKIIKKNLKQ
ncbi:MAG: hypothetical protein NC932_02625 [Candidatus Omnitrophica bacterium]|nr:hypothetical protein [Candidatus Omnitrophota bacterium]